MGIIAKLLFAAATSSVALAAPQPEITARALLPRVNSQTLGWYSQATSQGKTIYEPWAYDKDLTTYYTSSQWFRRCPVTATCTLWTGCVSGYLMAATTSSYCGTGGASGSYYCSYHALLTASGASNTYSWYWCDTAPLAGSTFYASLPANAYILTTDSGIASIGPSSTPATTTPPSSASSSTGDPSIVSTTSSSSTAASSTAPPPPAEKKSNTGAIAGGVVGGVAVLAAIGFGIFFLLHRNKKAKAAAAAPPVAQQWNPQGVAAYPPQPPLGGYAAYPQAQEQKPQDFVQHYPVAQNGQNVYPQQGAYDPHMSQHYSGSPPPLHGSPNNLQGGFVGELPANTPTAR